MVKSLRHDVLLLEHNGTRIFHVARWCGRMWLGFWYTLNPATVFAEHDGNREGVLDHFDIRKLPADYWPHGRIEQDDILQERVDHRTVLKTAINAQFDFATITLRNRDLYAESLTRSGL